MTVESGRSLALLQEGEEQQNENNGLQQGKLSVWEDLKLVRIIN